MAFIFLLLIRYRTNITINTTRIRQSSTPTTIGIGSGGAVGGEKGGGVVYPEIKADMQQVDFLFFTSAS